MIPNIASKLVSQSLSWMVVIDNYKADDDTAYGGDDEDVASNRGRLCEHVVLWSSSEGMKL